MSKKICSKKQQWNVEATTNLILLYENHPCLYRVKSKEYHNRNSRNKAYSDITHNLNTCHPDMAFNEAIVKNKIHTLRTQYTNEMNKIKKSEASGVSPDDVHKPTLWCFDLLRFLEDSEVIIQGESNLELESQHEIVAESEVESEIIFDGTIEDITNPFSPPESHDGEQSKKRPSSSVSQTPKRSCLSNLEEPLLYKKRDTPALNKRKQEDSQLSKLLDNATKAISSISEKSEDSNQYADIDLFTRYLGKEMQKIENDEILDNFKERESEVESEIIFDGTIEDITNPFSPPESHDGDQSKKRPSSSVSQTPKRSCLSNLEEPLLYKKRDTPALNKRKQEDSQLSKLLDNATKAISSISEKSEDSNQYADIDLFTRYLGKEMQKIENDEILDNFKERVMQQLMDAKRTYRENISTDD